MGTSAQPSATPGTPGREDVLLDDIEKNLKAQEDQDKKDKEAADAKAKADLEAKARADAAATTPADPRVKALEEALRISEEGRRRTEETMRSIGATPKKTEEPELTKEQLTELMRSDPLAAVLYMQERAAKTIEENIAKRIEPLISGGATGAKELARSKYPDEFQLFGADIDKMMNDPRISKSSLNQLQAWEDLIFYIRGQPGNIEKLVELRAGKEREKAAATAQAAQQASAGAHTRSEVRAPAPASGAELDELEREIARTIYSDLDREEAYSEYKKWKGVAR